MSNTEFKICAPKDTAWCPGCGDFGILASVKKALETAGKTTDKTLMMAGIGQAAKLPQYIDANGYCGLHGRSLPAAIGAKMANNDLTVLVNSGDGDIFGEGGNHFLHTVRRNIDITLMVHNNQIYGLTQGQASPLSYEGAVTKLQPRGVIHQPLNGLALALTIGCGFVARSFSGYIDHLTELIVQGMEHKGLSYIEILQPCPSMNKAQPFGWYKERTLDINENDAHDTSDRMAALDRAMKLDGKLPIGLFYRDDTKESFEQKTPQIKEKPLVEQPAISDAQMQKLFARHM